MGHEKLLHQRLPCKQPVLSCNSEALDQEVAASDLCWDRAAALEACQAVLQVMPTAAEAAVKAVPGNAAA